MRRLEARVDTGGEERNDCGGWTQRNENNFKRKYQYQSKKTTYLIVNEIIKCFLLTVC